MTHKEFRSIELVYHLHGTPDVEPCNMSTDIRIGDEYKSYEEALAEAKRRLLERIVDQDVTQWEINGIYEVHETIECSEALLPPDYTPGVKLVCCE
jgi:hypothetical protein